MADEEQSNDNDIIWEAGFSIDYDMYRKLTTDEKKNFNIVIIDIALANLKELKLDEA